ncbi:hypothetical protein AVENP_0189 [Arcobacter venerupis]|uniref:Uncharacterized protein n=1 Tax=Arcobacter venerupis TaxID=1054033 RepID=A0AAE7E2Z1_9BACT|nr:hypothetical protein [Arcobacter venerupis]QKF65769.1 hypothetical protein AVENP_0189 [Arcobacter venerupis]RWS50279.1 hypothetical protein CKA56_04910 [Arcobacter venerupis]
MISNKDSSDSPAFTFYTQKELEQKDSIKQIDLILEKYNILENDNQLISSFEKNILYIINYIESLFIKKESIPSDLEDLFLNNSSLKENINLYIEKKLLNLTKKDSIYFFKDINIMLHILSIGTNQKILESYNDYNFDSVSNLFRFYENRLKQLFLTNKELFSLSFDSYIILLRTITQLCNFNSIDEIAKRSIKYFIELMTESINLLKFNVLLDKTQLNKLNNIQGKYLYYFSYIDNIVFDIDDLKTTFENYFLMLERHEAGYIISSESGFGDETQNLDSQEFLIYKKNSSILILKLIKNLKANLDEESYFEQEEFQRILRFFYKKFSIYHSNDDVAQSLKVFQKDLLNSLLLNYHIDQDFKKQLDYHLIIDDFIFSQESLSNTNIEIIFQLLYFTDDIALYKYHLISQILVQHNPIHNDYHEYFKLAIFNLCINKSIHVKYNTDLENVLKKIYNYINDYKIASHLLSVYSKIYLSLSLLYSQNQIDIEKAKKLYATFVQINGLEILKNEYNEINLKILSNIQFPADFIVDEFLKNKNIKLKNELDNIKNKIEKNLLEPEMKTSLETFISNEIFHGVCETTIFNIEENLTILDAGFEEYQIVLQKYIIRLVFTSVYKSNFLSIFENNKFFLENDVYKILNNFKQKDTKFNILIDDEDEIEINY